MYLDSFKHIIHVKGYKSVRICSEFFKIYWNGITPTFIMIGCEKKCVAGVTQILVANYILCHLGNWWLCYIGIKYL